MAIPMLSDRLALSDHLGTPRGFILDFHIFLKSLTYKACLSSTLRELENRDKNHLSSTE